MSSSKDGSSFGGARPKVRRLEEEDGLVEEEEEEEEEENSSNCSGDYVYTYRGGDGFIADLPKSLYGLDLEDYPTSQGPPPHCPSLPPTGGERVNNNNDENSPEMDFLEMDFEENVSESPSISLNLEELEENGRWGGGGVAGDRGLRGREEGELSSLSAPPLPCSPLLKSVVRTHSLNSSLDDKAYNNDQCPEGRGTSDPSYVEGLTTCEERLPQRDTYLFKAPDKKIHSCSESEEDENEELIEKTMIWSGSEACQKQACQIGISGATAVMNVLKAFKYNPDLEEIDGPIIRTRLRNDDGDLSEYLFSRSVAGLSHEDLIMAMNAYSGGKIRGKFFSMYPRKKFSPSLSKWISNWIKKGAVPVATLNLQKGVKAGQILPDSWRHQMIFGVGPGIIHFMNPVECVSEAVVKEQLCSPSEILIRKSDIIKHWKPEMDLTSLRDVKDERWREMNVLGQVVHCLREECANKICQKYSGGLLEHIRIPAGYKSGVSMFMHEDSENFLDLMYSPELTNHVDQKIYSYL